MGGLFFEREGVAVVVEVDHAVALGVAHRVGKNSGALFARRGHREGVLDAVAKEDVVAQHQRHRFTLVELALEQKSLGDTAGLGLGHVAERNTKAATVAQQLLEGRQVLGRGDELDIAYAREHENRQRVVHHRLVVHRHELLGDNLGQRV